MILKFFQKRRRKIGAAPGKRICKEARQALREAADRRSVRDPAPVAVDEHKVQKPEPTRFGDWESGGRCSDF